MQYYLRRIVPVALILTALCVLLFWPRADQQTLHVLNWTYYIPDDVIEQFESETGVRVVYDTYSSNEEMYAKLKSGNSGYDVAFPSSDYTSMLASQGALEKIDSTRIATLKNIKPEILEISDFDPGTTWAVPYMLGAAGIAVNTALVPNFEPTSDIFARTDLKGKMTLLDDMREVIGMALKHLGYSVNSSNPIEIEQAKNLIKTWQPNILKFDAEGFGKGFANGEYWVSHGYQENFFGELDESMVKSTAFFIPKEGTQAYLDSMVIPKNAPHIDTAYAFIEFIHRPDIMARITDTLGLPSINTPAQDLKKSTPRYTLEDLATSEIRKDVGEAIALYDSAWQDIRYAH